MNQEPARFKKAQKICHFEDFYFFNFQVFKKKIWNTLSQYFWKAFYVYVYVSKKLLKLKKAIFIKIKFNSCHKSYELLLQRFWLDFLKFCINFLEIQKVQK